MSVTAFFEYLLAHESTEGLGTELSHAYTTRARNSSVSARDRNAR